eukprot:scaffold91674_cov68-Cyclotella_meneghiniana.AAC.3
MATASQPGLPGGCCAPAASSSGVQWPNFFVQPPHCEGQLPSESGVWVCVYCSLWTVRLSGIA